MATTQNTNAGSAGNAFAPKFARWRPFGPAKWRQTIRGSGLPASVQELLLGLVAETGLMANEKLEVAEELVAHFQDGLQRGWTISQLIEDFGDPNMVATLIRNGKQRNRTMKNRLAQATMWLGALSGGGFLILVIMFYFGKPNPRTDYLAILNKPIIETPEDQKAWPVYRDLWIKYSFSEGGSGQFNEIYFQPGGKDSRFVRPGDGEAWELAKRKMEESQDLLEGFRVGGVRPSFGVTYESNGANYSREDFQALFPNREFPTDTGNSADSHSDASSSMMMVLLPQVQVMRKAAGILVVDTRWAIEQGDSDRAVRNIEALLGISRQVTESKFLVAGLVGLAVQAIALDSVDELVNTDLKLTNEHLQRIQSAVELCQDCEYVSVEAERSGVLDVIQRTYTDDGNGDGRLTAEGLKAWREYMSMSQSINEETSGGLSGALASALEATVAPASLLFIASRKQLTDEADRLFEEFEGKLDKPFMDKSIQQVEQQIEDLGSGYVLLKMLFPAFQAVRAASLRLQGQRDGAVAGLAAMRFQREHGRWPKAWDELVGSYLDEVPLDPMDHQPLRFKHQDTSFFIYSVGVDLKDDAGRSATRTIESGDQATTETGEDGQKTEPQGPLPTNEYRFEMKQPGDWILWPRHSSFRDR